MLTFKGDHPQCAVMIAFVEDIPPASAPEQPVAVLDTSSNSYRALVYQADDIVEDCLEDAGSPGWSQLGESISLGQRTDQLTNSQHREMGLVFFWYSIL